MYMYAYCLWYHMQYTHAQCSLNINFMRAVEHIGTHNMMILRSSRPGGSFTHGGQ